MQVEPVVLEGENVRLEPLQSCNLDDLCAVGLEPELWRLAVNAVTDVEDMEAYIESALDDQRKGIAVPFVTVDKSSNTIVGSTRFGNIDVLNRKAEIGWTWINPRWQRTAVNTEAKLLMLTHAFEVWGCIRVELKTDALNERSQNAILRIGAKQEGILRNHMISETGRFRDSVFFSIIDEEWDGVKAGLLRKLGRS